MTMTTTTTTTGELAPYPDSEARERELEELAARGGGAVFSIGTSVGGRPIRACRVPASAPTSTSTPGAVPRVLVVANIHGPEWIGSRTALRVLRDVVEHDAHPLRARAELVVVPCLNVDGYARTEARGGRGTLKELRTNDNGVDLNRNFPVPASAGNASSLWSLLNPHWLTMAGSADPARATYRGTGPLSEPEARAVDELCARERFVAAVGLHSFMGTCIPPCVRTGAEARSYAGLCRAFRAGQRAAGRGSYPRFANRFVDVLTGEMEDRLHHDYGAWALTVECFSVLESVRQHLSAPSLFWRFNPRDPEPIARRDGAGVVAYLLAALDVPHPRRGTVGA